MKNITKIIIYNFLILFILIIIFELLFGYFLKPNNFGYMMRSERQKDQIYEVIHNEKKYRYHYKRNYYGFRGNEFLPSEINIVFEGGSTGNQKFTPEELTIVGLLNLKFNQTGKNFIIANASTDGKSTRGYINDLIYWFPKLKDFNPEFIIFYTGINDSYLSHPLDYDLPWKDNFYSKFTDYLKNNSKIVEIFKQLKFTYFNKQVRLEYGVTRMDNNLYKDYQYINYRSALDIHKNYTNKELESQFDKRLELLKKQINKFKFRPIFITQINFDGLSNPDLFLVNETLKNFCKKNNFSIIKLDEIIQNLDVNLFYDKMHTTPEGSVIISNKIYPQLLSIIE